MKKHIPTVILFFLVLWSVFLHASDITLEELRMSKRFGAGISAAGPLSVLGIEIDVNLTEQWSIGGGIGTGLDYSTMMLKGRYFLLGRSVSPYLAAGVARWWTSGTSEKNLRPSVLVNRFLNASTHVKEGFDVFIIYPAFGVQFLDPIGLSVSAELEYLFKLFDFSNGTYAGLALHWYF